MGAKNYLIEGVSCTGKTSVHHELVRRGFQSFNGDNEFAYQGNPETGEPLSRVSHDHHIWNMVQVTAATANNEFPATFFCGGSRNFHKFIQLFDAVFVLQIDVATLNDRLNKRPADDWGRNEEEKSLIRQMHATQADVPKDGIKIDATRPLTLVVDEILRHCN